MVPGKKQVHTDEYSVRLPFLLLPFICFSSMKRYKNNLRPYLSLYLQTEQGVGNKSSPGIYLNVLTARRRFWQQWQMIVTGDSTRGFSAVPHNLWSSTANHWRLLIWVKHEERPVKISPDTTSDILHCHVNVSVLYVLASTHRHQPTVWKQEPELHSTQSEILSPSMGFLRVLTSFSMNRVQSRATTGDAEVGGGNLQAAQDSIRL